MKDILGGRQQLHGKVADLLRAEILSLHKPGDKLEGERSLATRFGVSVGTLREALRSLAQDNLVHRRHGSGTYVNDRTPAQHVGVLIDLDVSHPRASQFHLRVGQELRAFLVQNGTPARLYLGQTQPGSYTLGITCPEFLEEMESGRMSAVAGVAAPWDWTWLEPIERMKLPMVGLWSDVFRHRVDLDYQSMVQQGTEHLLAQGCRRLALMGWSIAEESLTRDFRRVIEKAGGQTREAWIRTDLHPSLPGAGWEEFRELWTAFEEKPDGVLVLDDMLFDDIKTAILELGIRVPDQLKLVTHSNKGAGLTAPFPFARVEFDPDECARHLGEMLLKLVKKEPVTTPVIVQGFQWCKPEEGSGRGFSEKAMESAR